MGGGLPNVSLPSLHKLKGTPKGGGLPDCNPPPSNRNLRNTDFVDIKLLNVLRDLPFSRNQILKSPDI